MALSDELEEWLTGDEPRTLGSLVDRFGPGSFALLFVLLLAFPALPLPTGGISHVFEVLAMLLSLELIAGRREVWIPKRWRDRSLDGLTRPRVRAQLLKRIRWVERWSRPRLSDQLEWRGVRALFGALTFALSLTAFLAPPFSGLDTLPSMGVVVISLGVLFGDVVVAGFGVLLGAVGVAIVIGLGRAIAGLF